MSTTIDLAAAVVMTVIASGTTLLIGLVWGSREKVQNQRERVALRRARREELRHRAPELPDEGDPETIDPFVDEETAEVPALPGNLRFALGSGVTDLAVQFRRLRRSFNGERAILNATADELHATAFRPTASIFSDEPQHFVSAHLDEQLQAILDNASWADVTDLRLLEELTRRQPGMPTGAYPVVGATPTPANPWDRPKPGNPAPRPKLDGKPSAPKPLDPPPAPKLAGQPRVPAAVIRSIAAAAERARAGAR